MNRKFKIGIGALVSIVGDDQAVWERRIRQVENESPEFLEVWVEHWRGNRWLVKEKSKVIKSLLSSYEIILHAPFLWSSLVSPTVSIRERTLSELRATIELAALLEARVITIHGGAFYASYLRPEVDGKLIIVENLNELLPLADDAGTILAVENCPPIGGLPPTLIYPQSCTDLVELISNVPRVRVTLDIGHALQNNEPPLYAVTTLLPVLANIHLHDMNSNGQAHLELGEGILDLDAVLAALLDGGYAGYLTLEVSDPDKRKERIIRSYRRVIEHLSRLDDG